MPGKTESSTPPRIVKIDNTTSWNDPSAFGPVPEDKQASGDQICQSMGFASAIGYHQRAQDLNGNRFPNGGYFCDGKSDKASLTYPPSTARASNAIPAGAQVAGGAILATPLTDAYLQKANSPESVQAPVSPKSKATTQTSKKQAANKKKKKKKKVDNKKSIGS
jgi:hypothetical protein